MCGSAERTVKTMKEKIVGTKISRKNWAVVWMMGMVGQLCWAVENQSFSNYAHAVTGNASVITWMVALSAAATTVATFISGTLSDRRGRRKGLICFGFILWGLFTAAFGFGDFIPKSPIILFSVYVVAMDSVMSFFGSIGYSGAGNAWMTDISDETNRGQLATVISAMVVIANVIMGAAAGIIIDKFGFMTLFVGMGALVTVIGVVLFFVLDDSPALKPTVTYKSFWKQLLSSFRFGEMFRDRELFWVLTTLCVYTVGFDIYLSYATIYMVNFLGKASGITLNYFVSGAVQGLGMLLAVIVSIFFIGTINRGRPDKVTMLAVWLSAVFLVALSFARSLPALVICIFGAATGYILSLQATTAWYKNLCPVEKRGQIEGVKQIFYVLIPMIVGPLIAQAVIAKWGVVMKVGGVTKQVPTGSLFVTAGLWTLLTLIPLFFARREMKNKSLKAA
jgi:MFS family permease